MTAWKPGDVVTLRCGTSEHHRAMWIESANSDGAFYCEHGGGHPVTDPYQISGPMVVLDPEDREGVERACDAFLSAMDGRTNLDAMQAALRSLVADPKPDEPQGLGAVVEDDKGDAWVHDRDANPGYLGVEWLNVRTRSHRKYDDIAAVRVLSEGVPQ